jgi:hypothetical protein
MKKLIYSILLVLLVFIEGCSTSSENSPTSVMLILYSYPTQWQDNPELKELRDATDGKFVSVINPSNGPGLVTDEVFVDGIDYLYDQNMTIVSYIYTSYGYRDKQAIYDDIDSYATLYGSEKISGIFFDEVKLESSLDEEFVKDISAYAKSKNFDFIVLNPGTPVNQSIVDENYYDIILTYENSYDNYLTFTNTLLSSTKTKQALVVYGYPNLPSYEDDIKKAKDMNFDYIYLTIDSSENPWDTVFNFLK